MPIDWPNHASLEVGSKGPDVELWQQFLVEQKLLAPGDVDGSYGNHTKLATEAFQNTHGLKVDGCVGPNTWKAAAALNPQAPSQGPSQPPSSDGWPVLPSFPALTGEGREQLFGKFEWRATPTPDNQEAIQILGPWEKDNITSVQIPQLAGVRFSWSSQVSNGTMRFHRTAAPQLAALWSAWKDAGLLGRVVSYGGAYTARCQRGSTSLSNHAFGSAFDINVKENPLGSRPAVRGVPGSVVDLVSIANEHGFYWGGHFRQRPDGMHFEVAVLK